MSRHRRPRILAMAAAGALTILSVPAVLAVPAQIDRAAAQTAAPATAAPATAVSPNAPQPIEITAAGGIEWDRNAHTYTARGAAHAARGDLSVDADTLTARYRDDQKGGTEIYRLEALGNVRLVSASAVVTGDRADYDVVTRMATVTGSNLKMQTANEVVTARDKMEYSDRTHQATALGNVIAVGEGRRLEADRLTALLAPDDSGKLKIANLEAVGHVRIATEKEFVSANQGTYDVARQFAVLKGDVKITQEKNQLNGEYAEIDMKTGVSRLFGAAPGESGGRVKGLVLPGAVPGGT